MKELSVRNYYIKIVSLLIFILMLITLFASVNTVTNEVTISFALATLVMFFIVLYSSANLIRLKEIEEGASLIYRIENFTKKKDVIYWNNKWYRLVNVSFENGIYEMFTHTSNPNFMIDESYFRIMKFLYFNDYDQFAKCISTKIINFKTENNEIKESDKA